MNLIEATVLVVDDSTRIRAGLADLLSGQGAEVLDAADGAAALRMMRSHAGTTLVVTDIIMPEGMTGRELAERLRGHRPGLKVIIMSGHSSDILGHDTDFIRRTKSPFLQKPCSARVLLETVRRCLDET